MSTPGSPGNAPPLLVGRDRELGVLRQHLAAALAGQGSLVLIGGEAGIGKTALAEAFCREAQEQGALLLMGHCYDLMEASPYGPWVEAFGHYRQTDDLPPLPLAFSQRGTVGAVASQATLVQQVYDFFTALCARTPLVLVLEDLHWADPASLDVLRPLARQLPDRRLLVLVTYRSEEVGQQHPLSPLLPMLVREAHAQRLAVRPLDTDAVRSLVAERYHLPEADATRLVGHLRNRAEGNALFVGELLRALEETDVLRRVGERWTLAPLTETPVPPLLRQVIGARVSRLDGESQRLLAVGAIIGQEVPFAVWEVIVSVDEERLLEVVSEAERAHLMTEQPEGSGATFVHALVREALYEGVRPSQRRRWHRQTAEVLAALPSADPDAVASHFVRAGDMRAVAWLITAGERASRAYAWLTAATRYEAALALLAQTDARTAERGWLLFRLAILRTFVDPVQNIGYLDDALRLAEETGDHILAALARFEHGSERVHLRRETVAGMAEEAAGVAAMETLSPAEQARLIPEMQVVYKIPIAPGFFQWALMGDLAFMGRYQEVLAIAARGMARIPPVHGDGYLPLAMTYAMLGRAAEAGPMFAQARALLNEVEHFHLSGWVVYYELLMERLAYRPEEVAARRQLAHEGEAAWGKASDVRLEVQPGWPRLPLLLVEGEWAEARELAQVAYGYRLAYHREIASSALGLLAWWQGEPAIAWTHVGEMFPHGAQTPPGSKDFYEALVLQRVAARLALDADDLPLAHAWSAAHDRYLAWSGAVLGRAEGCLGWAAYHRAQGDHERAVLAASQALTSASDPRQPLALLAAHRLLGELDTDADRLAAAENHLTAALALADACAAPFERALTLLALAECHRAAGDTTAALALLAEVRAICVPLAASPTLAKADALAARLDAMIDTRPTYPAGLSAREVEVLRLIVTGQTNREIAATLSISVKTVLNHVTHILTKTNLPNRAAAVTFAHQHDLGPR